MDQVGQFVFQDEVEEVRGQDHHGNKGQQIVAGQAEAGKGKANDHQGYEVSVKSEFPEPEDEQQHSQDIEGNAQAVQDQGVEDSLERQGSGHQEQAETEHGPIGIENVEEAQKGPKGHGGENAPQHGKDLDGQRVGFPGVFAVFVQDFLPFH